MQKVVAIIQARMGSTRLPGKVMKILVGKTVLEHVVERVKKAQIIDEIVIATTTSKDDNLIVAETERLGVKYFRGSEEDVLSRYYYATKENSADIIIRITSDCPLIDSAVLGKMVSQFIEQHEIMQVDYMSNTLKRTYPRGLDTEIFTFNTLERAFREAKKDYEREHVTPYVYQNPQIFKIIGFESDKNYSDYRLTLDTEEDLDLITKVYESLYSDGRIFNTDEVINFLDQNLDIKGINMFIQQKALGV